MTDERRPRRRKRKKKGPWRGGQYDFKEGDDAIEAEFFIEVKGGGRKSVGCVHFFYPKQEGGRKVLHSKEAMAFMRADSQQIMASWIECRQIRAFPDSAHAERRRQLKR